MLRFLLEMDHTTLVIQLGDAETSWIVDGLQLNQRVEVFLFKLTDQVRDLVFDQVVSEIHHKGFVLQKISSLFDGVRYAEGAVPAECK